MSYIGIDPDVMVFVRRDVSSGPVMDLTVDLGTPILRWNNIYTGTLSTTTVNATTVNGTLDLNATANLEQVQDIVGGMVTGNVVAGITITYNDVTGKIDFNVGDPTLTLSGDVTGVATINDLGATTIATTVGNDSHNHTSGFITDFTEAAQDAYNAMLTAGTQTGITVTYNDVTNSLDMLVAAGAGSGADADTVDGLHAADFVQIAGSTMTGNLIIGGNLTVNGITTTVNTETINLADNIILINSNEIAAPTQNGGIEVERGTLANVQWVWDETNDYWTPLGTNIGNVGTVTATGFSGPLTGNASTATTLASPRNIALGGDVTGSTSFDGSANVTITATVVNDSHTHDTQYVRPGVAQVYTQQQNFGQTILTDGATVAWDLNTNQSSVLTMINTTATRQLVNPINQVAGGSYVIIVKQDATGGAALTFDTAYKFTGGTAPTITATANAVDILTFISDGSNMYCIAQQDFA